MAGKVAGNRKQQMVTLKSVVDGFTYEFVDDGYGQKNENRPNAGRQKVIKILDKLDQDGRPIFYATEPLSPWNSADGAVFQPIKRVPIWGEAQDATLAKNQEARGLAAELSEERIANGAAAQTSFAVDLASAAAEAKTEAATTEAIQSIPAGRKTRRSKGATS